MHTTYGSHDDSSKLCVTIVKKIQNIKLPWLSTPLAQW